MSYTLIIKQEAYEDLQKGYDYYEEKNTGLGEKILEKINERISYLQEYPLHFNKVEREYRQALIDIFPYVIVYELLENEIVIYSFFHCSRNPKKKFKK